MSDKSMNLSNNLGDITSILHNQGVSDLSWLMVNEEEYRRAETLPKQNLDIIPDLQKALARDDDGVPGIIPLKPHTIVNRNPIDTQVSPIDMSVPIRNRTARMVMAGLPVEEIRKRLALEYSPGDIHCATSAINEVLYERGLLGNAYINSEHFPHCATNINEQKYARTYGKRALFVLAKDQCVDCVCNKGGFCSSLDSKQLVDEIPYAKLVEHYADILSSEKRPVDISGIGEHQLPLSEREWKERLRSAFLRSPVVSHPDGIQRIQTQQLVIQPKVTNADMVAFWARRQAAFEIESMPSPEYMKYARRMMLGNNDVAILVSSNDAKLSSLASEYGLLGHTYLDMDALGGCRQTLSLIKSRNDNFITSRNDGIGVVPDFIVRRSSSCLHCKNLPDGACAEISRISTIVQFRPAANKRTFVRSLIRSVGSGYIERTAAQMVIKNVKDNADWTRLTAQVNLFRPVTKEESVYAGAVIKPHYGEPGREFEKATMDPEEIRRTLSHLMNKGLFGYKLKAALLQRYSLNDLRQVPEIGRKASVDDGIQGHYFIDPTAYQDYGRGCVEGSEYFRKQGAPYLLASNSCTGCILQTHPGWCSKYSKEMIRQVPTQVRVANIEARKKLPVIQIPVENPVEKYELKNELSVDLGNVRSSPEMIIPGNNLD
jgi:hypothetical protein